MRGWAAVLVVVSAAAAQTREYSCLPGAGVAQAMGEVERLRRTAPRDLFADQARAVMAEAVRQHPDDVFAHLRYLYLFRQQGHGDVIERYRTAMIAHLGDPRYALYYAASLIGTDTPDALRRLEELSATKGFPYPRLLIGDVRTYPKFRDTAAASASLLRFVEACPAYLPAYELLSYIGQGEGLGAAAARLRGVLQGRSDAEAVAAYPWLWAIEFKAAPPGEHAALRSRVERDLAALGNAATVETQRTAYRLTGNAEAAKALPPPERPRDPAVDSYQQWLSAHPAKDEAHQRELARAAREWSDQFPDDPMPQVILFRALAAVKDTSEDVLVAAGEQLIALNRRRPQRFLSTPATIEVAREYVKREIRMEEVPKLLAAGMRQADTVRRAPESDFFDDRNHRVNEEFRLQGRIAARGVEFDWSMKADARLKAREALKAMRADLDALFAEATELGAARFMDAEYWSKMAQLAEAEGRAEEAARYRATAEERRRARARPAAAARTESKLVPGQALPAFRLTGLDGKAWTPAELAGKVAVLNVWATWCAPCVEELPLVQQLYEQWRGRADVVVLTLNVDSNPGVVAPFVKARGFGFPVLLAAEYVEGILPDLGIPRTWVVSGGVLREEVGYVARGNGWQERVKAAVAAGR